MLSLNLTLLPITHPPPLSPSQLPQVSDSRILEKPTSPEHAIEMLQSLSGRSHHVYSGVALLVKKSTSSAESTEEEDYVVENFSVGTEVEFDTISREDIENYVATGVPMYNLVLE